MKQTLYCYVLTDIAGNEQWVALTEQEAEVLYKKLDRDLHEM